MKLDRIDTCNISKFLLFLTPKEDRLSSKQEIVNSNLVAASFFYLIFFSSSYEICFFLSKAVSTFRLGCTVKSWKLVAADKKSVRRQKSRDVWYIIPFPSLQFLGVGFYVWPAQLCSDNKIKMILKALSLLCRKLSWHKKSPISCFTQDLWSTVWSIEIVPLSKWGVRL